MKPLPELARLDKAAVDRIAAQKGITRQQMADVFDNDIMAEHALRGIGVDKKALPPLAELLGAELGEILATPQTAAGNAKFEKSKPWREWTPAEDKLLREHGHEGTQAVATLLGRSTKAVVNRASVNGVSLRKTAQAAEAPAEQQTAPAEITEPEMTPMEVAWAIAENETCPDSIAELEEDAAMLAVDESAPAVSSLLELALDDLLNERVASLHMLLDRTVSDESKQEILTIVGRIVDAVERRARV